MIDHILLDVIAALREAFEGALLEQQAVEERFQVDVFLGDVAFETSYSLPGEGNPPRVRADLSLDWPTWSQSAYRSWSIGEPPAEPPELVIEIALRVQRLAGTPDPVVVLAALAGEAPEFGSERLEQSGPMIEQLFESASDTPACAIEIAFQGSCPPRGTGARRPDKARRASRGPRTLGGVSTRASCRSRPGVPAA